MILPAGLVLISLARPLSSKRRIDNIQNFFLFEAGTFVPDEFEKVVVKYYQMSRCQMKGSRPMQTVKPARQKNLSGRGGTLEVPPFGMGEHESGLS